MNRPGKNSAGRLLLGTRGSMLAVAQTNWVADQLRAHYPELHISIKLFTTAGDRSQSIDRPMSELGGKGLFTGELEAALAEGTIDAAVHSAKDLPAGLADGTAVLAWPVREDARDALILGPREAVAGSLESIPPNATFGCGSLRRIGQIMSLRPDLDIRPIRGNIETRINKVRQGQFAATLLAVAGLKRTGMLSHAAAVLSVEQMTPAAGQGALAIQGRAGDERIADLLSAIDHPPTRRAVLAERIVVARLAGGCNMPLGVYVCDQAGRLHGRAVLAHPAGQPRIDADADADSPEQLADRLVEQLHRLGARDILDSVIISPP